jgi:putative ABC transport system permease protein
MLKHYINIALRNLSKQKGLSFINVFGLSVGLACFILFLLFAVNEFSFDRFHKNGDNIYRVYLNIDAIKGEEAHTATYHPIPLGPALKAEMPEVANYVRIKEGIFSENFIRVNNKVTRANLNFADASFFSVFSFPLYAGNATSALSKINNIVLTKEKAIQLFGTPDVIGKLVEIKIEDSFVSFIVSAVANDIPANSSIRFALLGSFDYFTATQEGKRSAGNWQRSGYQTYVQLQPGASADKSLTKLDGIRNKYYPDESASLKKAGAWNGQGLLPISYRLQPLREMHTTIAIGGGSIVPVNPKTIWLLLAIATGVLLIACINFTTLSIGRSAGRAKEIGVRKVIGSNKKQVVFQFLSEALFLSILSGLLGFILSRLLLPYFNQLSGRDVQFSFSHYPEMLWFLIGLILVVGLLAGSYPALVLSRFRPTEVLKSKVRVGGSNLFTRSLVTLQFTVSIGLIVSTIIILQQLSYMKEKNPGFNKENVVMIDAEGTETKKIYPLFKQALAKEPSIASVAGAELGTGFDYEGKQKEIYEYFVDNNYINLMGIQILAGRNFDARLASDTLTSVIINEAMMNDFGWTLQNAVGKELKGYSENFTPVVIGVAKNIHFRPLSEKVEPQLFQQFRNYSPYKYLVRIKPGNPATGMAAIQKAWAGVEPVLPLKYDFMDASIDNFYKAEQRWSYIVGWAGGISIFLACMGLFGLAALASINRTKEIGIRKVLGASI